MTLFAKLATSDITKSPLAPLTKGDIAQQGRFPLFEKEGSGEILDRVI